MQFDELSRRLSGIEEASKKDSPIRKLHRLIFMPEIWQEAYANIYANKGAITKGINDNTLDGFSMKRVEGILQAIRKAKYRFTPVRRTYIPKRVGNKKRPLGIPTGDDKLVQEVSRIILERIYEPIFSDNSHGFRPNRSCHTTLKRIQRTWTGVKWFVEFDIKGFFDNISHDHILNTLNTWHTPDNIMNIIGRMLRAKILRNDVLNDTETGTPQGGILSPMLANVALTALDEYCNKEFGEPTQLSKKQGGSYIQNPIVRYADDFIVVCKTEQEAEYIKGLIATFLKDNIGLELSEEKTTITHISEGVDFLGFNLRKYTSKSPRGKYHQVGILLIKPKKEKVINFLKRIQEALDNNKTAKQERIMQMLNPMLQGFGMYYRFAVSQKTFTSIDKQVWQKLWRWAKRRHPKKPTSWIMNKYFTKTGRKWVFKEVTGKKIIITASIPIVRFAKIKSGMRLHADDKVTKEYWKKRVYTNALNQVWSIKIEGLMKRQNGICSCCKNPITGDDIKDSKVHVHHMLPRSKGGTEKLNNLRLLHQDCSPELTDAQRLTVMC